MNLQMLAFLNQRAMDEIDLSPQPMLALLEDQRDLDSFFQHENTVLQNYQSCKMHLDTVKEILEAVEDPMAFVDVFAKDPEFINVFGSDPSCWYKNVRDYVETMDKFDIEGGFHFTDGDAAFFEAFADGTLPPGAQMAITHGMTISKDLYPEKEDEVNTENLVGVVIFYLQIYLIVKMIRNMASVRTNLGQIENLAKVVEVDKLKTVTVKNLLPKDKFTAVIAQIQEMTDELYKQLGNIPTSMNIESYEKAEKKLQEALDAISDANAQHKANMRENKKVPIYDRGWASRADFAKAGNTMRLLVRSFSQLLVRVKDVNGAKKKVDESRKAEISALSKKFGKTIKVMSKTINKLIMPLGKASRLSSPMINSFIKAKGPEVSTEGIGKKVLIGTAIAAGVAIQAANIYFMSKLRRYIREQQDMEVQLVKMLSMTRTMDQTILDQCKSAYLLDYPTFTSLIFESKKLLDSFETSLKKLPNNIDLDGAFAAVRDCKFLSADDKWSGNITVITAQDYAPEMGALPIGQRGWTPANVTKAIDDIRAHWKQLNDLSVIFLKLVGDTNVVKIQKETLSSFFALIENGLEEVHGMVLGQSSALLKALKSVEKLSKKNSSVSTEGLIHQTTKGNLAVIKELDPVLGKITFQHYSWKREEKLKIRLWGKEYAIRVEIGTPKGSKPTVKQIQVFSLLEKTLGAFIEKNIKVIQRYFKVSVYTDGQFSESVVKNDLIPESLIIKENADYGISFYSNFDQEHGVILFNNSGTIGCSAIGEWF